MGSLRDGCAERGVTIPPLPDLTLSRKDTCIKDKAEGLLDTVHDEKMCISLETVNHSSGTNTLKILKVERWAGSAQKAGW